MAKIQKVFAEKILGFQGQETIEVTVFDDQERSAGFRVPFGKSEGSFEATYLAPDKAVAICNVTLNDILKGMDPIDQASLDAKMIEADGTVQKQNLGGNSLLGVSVANARLAALEQNIPLFRHFLALFALKNRAKPPEMKDFVFPRILYNLIEGGVHAKNNVIFQEHLIIPKMNSLAEQIETIKNFSRTFGKEVVKQGWDATAWGNEGGWAGNVLDHTHDGFETEFEVMDLMNAIRGQNQYQVDFGIDIAANNVARFDPARACETYQGLTARYPVIYLEDPFRETGDEVWYGKLFSEVHDSVFVVGDDLTVSNPRKIKEYLGKNMINGVIIKPDQVGTLSEVFEAIAMARAQNWKIIVSHRSQETTDDYLADLAVGVGADFVKFGAFTQGERLAKYNRLLEIEE